VGSLSCHPPFIVEGGGSMGHLTDGGDAPSKDTAAREPKATDYRPPRDSGEAAASTDSFPERTESFPPPEVQMAAYLEQAELLAAGGVDAIFCEMLTRRDVALRAVEAALTVGLPVFVGFVCRVNMTYEELDDPATIAGGTGEGSVALSLCTTALTK
jgi:hypothetical protein